MDVGGLRNDRLIGSVVRGSIERWASSQNASRSETVEEYHDYTTRKWLFIIGCFISLVVCCGISLTVGEYILIDHLLGNVGADDISRLKDYIIFDLRLPKIVVGIVAGFALAVCGVAMQSLLKNPLADPYTTGVSSGAGFGATLAIVMGASIATSEYAIVINAFIFALIPAAFIMLISTFRKPSPATIILSGIALMYIFNAIQSYMMLIADPNAASSVYAWTVGSLNSIRWEQIPFLLAVSLFGGIALMYMARILNTMNSGDAYSKSIGININRARMIVLLVVSLVSAGIVSFTGIIGFIGLVAPHIVRIFLGSDNRYLIPASAAFGAVLLMVADLISRVVIAPTFLPVGVITAFIGCPMFLYLLIKQRRSMW